MNYLKITFKKRLAILLTISFCFHALPVSAYGETTSNSSFFDETLTSDSYQTWKSSVWENNESADSGKIVITPGTNETSINFTWYSSTVSTPAIKLSTTNDMKHETIYNGVSTKISRSNYKNYYAATNTVTLPHVLKEHTTYYYCYTDNINSDSPVWSDTYTYTTYDFDSFDAIIAGDPQIGASGSDGEGTADDINIAADTYNWNKTLETASNFSPNASLLLSLGDQINYSKTDESDTNNVRESEYAGFLYPSLLRSLPIAAAIGNHESKGSDYQYHFSNPNSSESLGATASGCDYYFSYDNVLFIVLNSNNRNVEEHEQLLKEAVSSNKNAKWRIVMLHHDIYGSGNSHSNTDSANLRILFAPLMDSYNIDICLSGHDHSYSRSYQLLDGTAINYCGNQVTNPDGTLYLSFGSASGSKFYTLSSEKQYYIAERSNTQVPTFSLMSFSNNSLTLKTYDYDGNKYADDFTITKTHSEESGICLIRQASNIKESAYTTDSVTAVKNAAAEFEKMIEYTGEDPAIAALTELYDNNLNSDNPLDPLDYYGHAQDDYADSISGTARLRQGFSTLLDKTTLLKITLNANNYKTAYDKLASSLKKLKPR